MRELSGHYQLVTAVAFSPGGKKIVSGSHDEMVKIWDAESLPEVRCVR